MGSNNPETMSWWKHSRRAYGGSALLLIALASASVLLAPSLSFGGPILAGDDLWVTPAGASWDLHTIPAGTFTSAVNGEPSLAYNGGMLLMGSPLATNNAALFPIDTVVRRGPTSLSFMCAIPPVPETVPIELVALSLVSSSPITISYPSDPDELWDVSVCKAPGAPPAGSSMTLSHDCLNGGTYSATLMVQAQLTFTRVNPLPAVTTGPITVGPYAFTSSGWWSHADPGLFLIVAVAGDMVDTDCNAAFDTGISSSLPGPSGFFPGLDSADCTICTANGNFKKKLTPEEELLAAHGVFVANRNKPELVGACCGSTGCQMTGQTQCPTPDWQPGVQCTPDPCFGNPPCGDGLCFSSNGENPCTCPLDCGPQTASEVGLCNDGIDNDCDGAVDCIDSDCASEAGMCSDGLDNDCDTFIDCADSDCAGDPACLCGNGACDPGEQCVCADCPVAQNEIGVGPCTDGIDNDCDRAIDCADSECATDPPCAAGYKNWVIADDFMVACAECTCDLNRDGTCDPTDDAIVHNCQVDPTPPICRNADLDCDGDVDATDRARLECLLNGNPPEVCCPNPQPRPAINKLRWFGSYLDPAFDPKLTFPNREPDGWYVALHSDLPAVACPAKPGLKTIDLCGTLVQGVECIMFQPQGSTNLYSIMDATLLTQGGYGVGDTVRICGHLDTGPSFCMQGLANLVVNAAMDCDTAVSRPDKLIVQWGFRNLDVIRENVGKVGCDGHPIYGYTVDLRKGCWLHMAAGTDEIPVYANGFPVPNSPFFPRPGRTYWLSIQAEVGFDTEKYAPTGLCIIQKTPNNVTREFWGWHTTPPGYQQKDDAYIGQLAMCPPHELLYEWTMGPLHCSDPRFRDCCDDPTKSIDMAFCLLGQRRVCAGTNIPCTTNADCAGTVCQDVDATWWCQPVNGGPPPVTDPPALPRPFPVGGIDELTNTNAFLVVSFPDGTTSELRLSGPVVVARTGGPDQVQPQPDPPRPLPSTIETEMLMLDLRGAGGEVVKLNKDVKVFGGMSTGKGINENGTNKGAHAYPATATFDVFFEVDIPGRPPVVSRGPVRIEAQIHEAPPGPVSYQGTGGPTGQPVELVDKTTGQTVGTLKFVEHQIIPRGGIDIHSDTDWVGIPTAPCCAPDRTNTLTYCSKGTCPNPDEKCYPTAIAYDADGPYALDCACQKVEKCRLAVPEDLILPICMNSCPDSTQQCLDSGTGTATDPYKCECGSTPVCEPNAAGTACVQACPTGQECIPKKVKCTPGATSCSIVECECKDQNCHVDLNAAGLPYCVNKCPVDPVNPLTCELRGTDTDGDGVNDLFDCFCDPPPPACEPNSLGTGCNPVACPAADEKCKPKCVVFDPVTGKVTLDTCECLGPTECHMELATPPPGGGAASVAGAGATGDPCVVADDGSGTVQLPPVGCEYLSPDEVHKIVDGLPAGTTIELAAIHKDFICRTSDPAAAPPVCTFPTPTLEGDCDEDGGSLGGGKECVNSTLELHLKGTGDLNAFMRDLTVLVSFETHTAPRMAATAAAVQSFDTDMFRLGGELPPGDPDFDLLRIRAGTDFGMPSPGHTTLTRVPGLKWVVDSFFDIEYQIDFIGAPGGPFAGMNGSTTGTIRMQTKAFKCVGDCPAGWTCEEKRTPQADGTVKVCCECVAPPACEPLPDGSGCTDFNCPCFGQCINGSYCDDPNCCLDPNNCPVCYAKNTQESIKLCGDCFGQCINGSYCDSGLPGCSLAELPVCWVPWYHYSVYLCGDCFGTCRDGWYCDHPNPDCCLDPGNCQCYPPTDPTSIKMCGGLDKCKPKCVKYDQLTGQVTVEQCDCVGEECYVKFGPGAVTAGPGGPCEVVDNGSGSVDLPPAGCDYLSPQEVHKIIDGLPAGTEIHLAPIHKDFICRKGQQGVCSFLDVDCKEDGGDLGGEKECSDSTLEFQLTGTGTLAGWNRIVTIPNTGFETHIGKKKPFEPVQSFPTEMFRLQGQTGNNVGIGDPDFDLLKITAGSDFGLPSPGHTTLTLLPNGKWAVDSFFDIEYRIEFIGSNAPGSQLVGRSGSTTATIRMATNAPFKCTNTCPLGQTCVQTTTQPTPPDGTMTVCCDCVDAAVCEPKPDKKSCTNNTCPPGVVCKPKKIRCYPAPRGCEIEECECLDGDPCHPEMPPAGATEPVCTGACPPPSPPNKCVRKKVALPPPPLGPGGFEYTCRCVPVHPKPVAADPSVPGKNRHLSVAYAGSPSTTAGPGVMLALRLRLTDLQNPDPPNLPQFPPPDFSAYEEATCTAAGEMGSCERWAGRPGTFLESQDQPELGTYRASRLQCSPYFFDWSLETSVNVTGAEIAPSSLYAAQLVDIACADTLEEDCFSEALVLSTARSGDVEVLFQLPSPADLSQPDVTDVAQLVNKFKNVAGAPPKSVAQMQPNAPEPNADLNALDIVAVVDAVKQRAYAFSGPCPCPSLMTCGTTSCATDTVCIALPEASGGGAGAKCVNTCVGGDNDGEPCINNTHCPGVGAVCGAGGMTPGFCRDRCARCKP